MRCEVCGRKIYGTPHHVIIEKAKLTVCNECSKHGTATWEEPKPMIIRQKLKTVHQPLKVQSQKKPATTITSSVELVENFEAKIRHGREKLGLTHKELGKKINEKESVLKKIETGKMTPDNKLATKLEYTLKIKLLVPTTEEKVSKTIIPKPTSRELTLGDLIELNGKGKEDQTERKPS